MNIILDGILDIRSNQTFILFTYGEMGKEKSELIQEALDTLQAVTLSGRSTEGYVAELFENIRNLEEENKNLNIKVASLEGEIKGLNSVIDKLKEENQTLELWLDNKEKLNKGYREDVDYWHHRCMVAERGGEDED